MDGGMNVRVFDMGKSIKAHSTLVAKDVVVSRKL